LGPESEIFQSAATSYNQKSVTMVSIKLKVKSTHITSLYTRRRNV
jgi:hypothetical protein